MSQNASGAARAGTGKEAGSSITNAVSATQNRRRSSAAGQAGLFNGLMNQKRNSVDATHQARKASFAEQKPSPGIIGQMWNSWTKGNGK